MPQTLPSSTLRGAPRPEASGAAVRPGAANGATLYETPRPPPGSYSVLRFDVGGVDVQFDLGRCLQLWQGMPVITMWTDSTVAGLMLGMQRMVGTERFNLALQSGGRDSVEGDWGVIVQYPSFEEGFRAIALVAMTAGWGGWEVVSIDRDRQEARFRCRNSWEGLYQRKLGVCWGSSMLAGKFAGMVSRLFGVNCWAEQKAFIARGDDTDEFVVRPSDRTLEGELERLLASDEATRADLAVALHKLQGEVAERRLAEEALRRSEQEKLELIARQQQTIVTMSTPIIQVWKGVLTLPIMGTLDAARATDIMDKLLDRIVASSAHHAILDLTGVESVDEATADHLLRIMRAVELLGARVVITGIRPAVARSIVALGADLASLTTVANLEEGLKVCWRSMGLLPAARKRPGGAAPAARSL